jgi:hypothetical protein
MNELLSQIPEKVQPHLKKMVKTSGMPDDDFTMEKMAEGWLEKQKTFTDEISTMGMEEVDELDKDDERACLALTYSGSLINIGPLKDGRRKTSYASIGLRKDVPDLLTDDDSVLDHSIHTDESIEFSSGPIKKTSAIYKISVCRDDIDSEEQEEIIENAQTMIMENFVDVNNNIIYDYT